MPPEHGSPNSAHVYEALKPAAPTEPSDVNSMRRALPELVIAPGTELPASSSTVGSDAEAPSMTYT